MASNAKRILVYLKKAKAKDTQETIARFSQCILEFFDAKGLTTDLHAELVNNRLVITDDIVGKTPIKIKHPPFCPIMHLKEETTLPPETVSRGIDTGAAVIMETGDSKVLITRRAKHLRAFPGIWVPPGGHIEENESFVEAGLREFAEETGIKLQPSQCVGQKLEVLALWESVYPPKLSHGDPRRHHVVVYLYGKLTPDLTSDVLQKQLKMQPEEVDACMWLDRNLLSAIVNMSSEEGADSAQQFHIPEKVKATILSAEKTQEETELPLAPLLQTSGEKEVQGRVSTGTKFAIEEFLKRYQS